MFGHECKPGTGVASSPCCAEETPSTSMKSVPVPISVSTEVGTASSPNSRQEALGRQDDDQVADCKLGKVTKKGAVGQGAKVVKQEPKAGTTCAPGSKINVVLGGK